MFEVESVPSRDNDSYLLLLLSRHNVYKTNHERTIGCKVCGCKRHNQISPRAGNRFNQVVEAKRFEGVFLCRKVC